MLKEAIISLKADIVLLQEVAGVKNQKDSKTSEQLEILADRVWPFQAYGKNSVFSKGYHGNAILSRFPIEVSKNTDISVVRGLVKRGLLYAELRIAEKLPRLPVIATHLGLIQAERQRQVKRLSEFIQKNVKPDSWLVMGGDFNDWRETISKKLHKSVRLEEAFLKLHRQHARTFPSPFPVLKLDRIYYRGLTVKKAIRVKGRPWLFLSDHLPLVVDFDFS